MEYSSEMSEGISSEFKYFFLYYAFGVIIKDLIITYWDNDDPFVSTYSYIILGLAVFNFIFNIPLKLSNLQKDKRSKFEGTYDKMVYEYPFKYKLTNPYFILKEELDELES